jgi:hypothetical protein
MAGKGTTFRNQNLKLIYNATPIANLADNAAAAPLTSLYVSLHNGDPVAGDQTTSEVGYTSYARIPVSRNSGGWAVSGNQVTNVGAIQFPAATGGSANATHFAVGTSLNGAGEILHCGALTTPLSIGLDVAPRIEAGQLTGTST